MRRLDVGAIISCEFLSDSYKYSYFSKHLWGDCLAARTNRLWVVGPLSEPLSNQEGADHISYFVRQILVNVMSGVVKHLNLKLTLEIMVTWLRALSREQGCYIRCQGSNVRCHRRLLVNCGNGAPSLVN